MAARAKQLLINYIRPRKNIDINDIKEIKKKKDITMMINLIYDRISDKSDLRNGLLFYFENIFVYYKQLYLGFKNCEEFFLYDKDNNCLMKYYYLWFYAKYFRDNNNNIVKLYSSPYYIDGQRNKCYLGFKLSKVFIYKNKNKKYVYNYYGKIKNDKYKANYRLLYICFV
jgi:hypothetical protein